MDLNDKLTRSLEKTKSPLLRTEIEKELKKLKKRRIEEEVEDEGLVEARKLVYKLIEYTRVKDDDRAVDEFKREEEKMVKLIKENKKVEKDVKMKKYCYSCKRIDSVNWRKHPLHGFLGGGGGLDIGAYVDTEAYNSIYCNVCSFKLNHTGYNRALFYYSCTPTQQAFMRGAKEKSLKMYQKEIQRIKARKGKKYDSV